MNDALKAIDASSLMLFIYQNGEPVKNVATVPNIQMPDCVQV
jgi:hypothetical protein